MVGSSGDNNGSLITFKDFFAGTVAGILQVLVGQPFDIIKVRLQSQSLDNPVYKGTVDCAKQILNNEGIGTFYRGTLSPLIGVGICVSIQFGVNEACKRMLKNYKKSKHADSESNSSKKRLSASASASSVSSTNSTAIQPLPEMLSILELSTCGAVAGVVNSIASIPVEHIRIRMQLEGTKLIKTYSGSFDCLFKIYKQHGIAGIYKGGGPTIPREAIAYFFYFGMYEASIQWVANKYYNNTRNDVPFR